MPAAREDKPPWSAVPATVSAETERILGGRVTSARRAFGGYGPSATFRLTLADGRRAFFKGTYPLPEGSGVQWMLEEEARIYQEVGDLLLPWGPDLYGEIRTEGWHVLLLEDVGGQRFPPWPEAATRRAFHSYAEFHTSTAGRALPDWLPRDTDMGLYDAWRDILAADDAQSSLAALAGEQQATARSWLDSNLAALETAAQGMSGTTDDAALVHLDTRSDNIRLQGDLLRIFDWPYASVGPPEVDLVAFAQSITGEGGPEPEQVVSWYTEVRPVRPALMAAGIAALSGFFALRAPRPEMVGVPRLRSWQRRQLKACLRWAARALDLDHPAWLDSVAD